MNKLIILFLSVFYSVAQGNGLALETANEIRREALLPSSSKLGYPLPLIGHWNSGERPNTYEPKYQISLIEKGHHLLPWFHLDIPGMRSDIRIKHYYKPSINRAADLKLPISFTSSQWERVLTEDKKYLKLSGEINPNVVDRQGNVLKKVSPMGATNAWQEVGKKWTNRTVLKELQRIYPDPPLVLFVSNNEHKKLNWYDANQDYRYVARHGVNTSESEKKEVFAEEWIKLYRSLQQGIKDGLDSNLWKENARFVGYNAFNTSAMGRWPGWKKYSLETTEFISPWPRVWDGASPPFYTHNWDPSTDYNVWGPMVSAMNWVPMKDETYKINPEFWFELSIWDGNQPGKLNDKRRFYQLQGQHYDSKRYGGMVKYAMWLLRPRLVREFRNPDQTLKKTESYFMEIVNAVDSLYKNSLLEKFWRKGELVANNSFKHPYQDDIPATYKEKSRWFLLNTNYDAKKPWNLHTEIPVFCIALQLGKLPNREWLVYSFSPLGERNNVVVEIPDYKTVNINTYRGGAFYHIIEADHLVNLIE